MVDELDLLKRDWQKQNDNLPKLSQEDIYPMLLKRSSSIVRWIFIISILEFILWAAISFFSSEKDITNKLSGYNGGYIWYILSVIGYIVLGYFFYRFYKNYKTISATDNAKQLMENILKTRRTVKQYVGFNLIYLVVSVIVVSGVMFVQDQKIASSIEAIKSNGNMLLLFAFIALILIAVTGLLFLFYVLIYGTLLKRLNKNYKELKQMEF